MAKPDKIRQAADAATNARAKKCHRVTLMKYLSDCLPNIKHCDELFIRAVNKCYSALDRYSRRDEVYVKTWILKILEKIYETQNQKN